MENVDEVSFSMDRMRQRAVERVLLIIGEAAKQMRDETRAAIDQPWREMIRFRDRGVHRYEALSPGVLYGIATTSIPELGIAIERYLESSSR